MKKPKLGQEIFCILNEEHIPECPYIFRGNVFMKGKGSFLFYPYIVIQAMWEWWYVGYNKNWFTSLKKAEKAFIKKYNLNKNTKFQEKYDGETTYYVPLTSKKIQPKD